MDIIEQIKSLAGGAADKVLEKFDAKRIGAEAERRGLFQAWMRNASNETLIDLLRERRFCFNVLLTDDELKAEFAARGLRDKDSIAAGWDTRDERSKQETADEAARVKALAFEIIERANLL